MAFAANLTNKRSNVNNYIQIITVIKKQSTVLKYSNKWRKKKWRTKRDEEEEEEKEE